MGDITYVRLKEHFVYVCLLMDVFTRMIRSWSLSEHLSQPLTLKPLKRALGEACRRFIILIKVFSIFQVHISPLSVGMALRFQSPVEGVLGRAERLIRTLKEEEVHRNDYENITEARDRMGHFIEQVYNVKHPHSALRYLTPVEFEQKNLA